MDELWQGRQSLLVHLLIQITRKQRFTASRVLQLGFVMELALAFMLGLGLHFGAKLFTKDDNVPHLISIGIPFVALTQPINALAFVFDGINFGESDFAYSGYSMVSVAIFSILCLLVSFFETRVRWH